MSAQIPELNKDSVRIKDKERVLNIIKNVVNGGLDRLQVVADFDSTLTRFVDESGQPCDTCYSVLKTNKRFSPSYRESASLLERKYYPIEMDPNLSKAEKIPQMIEWWTKAQSLLLDMKLKQDDIALMVSESTFKFRDGCEWLFPHLHKHSVPLLIFSAGIGDIIMEVFKQRAVYYNNMNVVSNFFDFNEEGVVTGLKGELVHVFNKNENAIHESSYFEDLKHRGNIILMGDSLGDLGMADGAVNCENIIRIGYLNDKIEDLLPLYLDSFDIVLVNDQTMDIPNAIIRQMTTGQ